MLDIFSDGHVTRISPEAPVPVLRLVSERQIPGGAANVARNFAALGGVATLVGVVGDDTAGHGLAAALSVCEGLDAALIHDTSRRTIVKQRFTAAGQQILRADIEDTHPLTPEIKAELLAVIAGAMAGCDIVLVSDYAKGAINTEIMAEINTLAKRHKIPVLVDPKRPDLAAYGVCALIKPNAKELAEATGLPTQTDAEIEAALAQARAHALADTILVTRAEKGMSALVEGEAIHKAGAAKEVFDVSGAGDTVMAALGYALADGGNLTEAMALAVKASGIVVGKRGTAVVNRADLADKPTSGVFETVDALLPVVSDWRKGGNTIGFTNGCFDILHPGHLRILGASKAACDRLIVGLNTDASVKRLKGDTRPINTEIDRAILLAGLAVVDAVVLFDTDTPRALIEALQPDILAKGGDYTEDMIVGADSVKNRGGTVLIVPLLDGKSTTNIINRSNF